MKHKRLRVDWSAVNEKLAQNERALERALRAGRERVETEFRKRAIRFAARRSHLEAVAEGHSQRTARSVMVFSLGQERYAIDLAAILGVRPFADCTPVSSAPPQIRGIIHLHGELRTVVDLRLLMELPESEAVSRGYILRVRRGDGEIGLVVDEVEHVRKVADSDLSDPGPLRGGMQADYVRGISSDGLIVLDAHALFAHPLFSEERS